MFSTVSLAQTALLTWAGALQQTTLCLLDQAHTNSPIERIENNLKKLSTGRQELAIFSQSHEANRDDHQSLLDALQRV